MTIIAYSAHEEIMGCDSAWTHNDKIVAKQTKIVRFANGALLGDAGDADARDMRDLLRGATQSNLPSRNALAELKMDFHGLLVLRNGRVFDIDSGYDKDHSSWWGSIFELKGRQVFATGIGATFCLGAMASGAPVAKAVNLTCQWVDGCRGPVIIEPLKLPRTR